MSVGGRGRLALIALACIASVSEFVKDAVRRRLEELEGAEEEKQKHSR